MMSWLRIDDKFPSHPKVAQLSDREFRVHMRALCYCAEYRTDGVLPVAAVGEIRGLTPRVTDRLIKVGLWERENGVLRIHDFPDYNGRDAVQREEARVRKASQRERDKRVT
jgi:hypothetical protein